MRPREAGRAAALAALGAALSLLRTGFAFNVDNNVFHLPIVLRFAAMPQFADDTVVRSLAGFVSPVWPALALVATEGNVAALFFCGLALTRWLTFLGLLAIGAAVGIRRGGEQLMLLLLLATAITLYGYSPVGDSGLLISNFTQTELACAVALLALAGIIGGSLPWAGALAGIAFALNAFVGVWLVAPLAVWLGGAFLRAADGRERLAVLRRGVGAALAYAVPAAPVALWILRVTHGAVVDYDYRAYLHEYFPYHFFLSASPPRSILTLAAVGLAAVLAALGLPRRGAVLGILASLGAVFGAGAAVGAWLDVRLLFNLHLMRVDGLIVLVANVLVAAAAVRAWRGASAAVMVGSLLAVSLLAGGNWVGVSLAMVLVAVLRRWANARAGVGWNALSPGSHAVRLGAVLALSLFAGIYATLSRASAPGVPPGREDLTGVFARAPEWRQVQLWVRAHTPPASLFLIPVAFEDFRTGAERRIWVDWKDGATAMWAPETYAEWHRRRIEVKALADPAARLAYACAHGIDFVVLDLRERDGAPVSPETAAFHNRWFEVQPARCAQPPR